ncbi:DUF1315 family protein [Colwellia sp. 4_MG-2023]|jgi:uncharacterized protein YeaC (DUF1315 family)|uniref:YeaC family protein n=1 Tax=unclassified Colwellia TaxID=196834 RepID=UPI001C0831D2|nr:MULTISPECIES: DUF1315 family protein [unclassified Colwellia]MBU2926069.1 DUF1315 family protein [Colwellia sp. C2M11]MDO6487099.1 DUF1315 family protein [Colwellia sp. 6_MG-2023]MDO6508546.1 DUF1315 family protein [Colwellia sp. 5_MG-2023]MDO6557161.1 DUF1315 family protein [Colwellia sp. 4_MG-2023]MDO6653210.1 DUF1315 family protein [Colwellia sp. 3_MG-2023]
MNLQDTIEHMPEAMYLRLKCAAETGKWPEGTVVEQAQRDTALQLIMAYQARHLNSDEMLTIGSDGQMVHKNKRQLKEQFSSNTKEETVSASSIANSENESSIKSDIAHFTNL